MSVSLRPCAAEDAAQIAEVLLSSRKAFLPYAPSAHTDSNVRQWVTRSLIASGGVTVAEFDASIVGVLATSREGDVSWLNQLYVAPGHVGQGIGSLLLQHALRTLALPVRLYTFAPNARARAFYEHRGFKAVEFTDGSSNEERCPDVLYELAANSSGGA